jgi:protein-tyrosine-phosphatase
MAATFTSNSGQIWTRRALLLAGLALPVAAAAKSRSIKRGPTVLFICQYGTVKSAIARELFRRRAAERGIAATTFSRGLTIAADHRSAALIAALARDGINADADPAKNLTRKDWRRADIVVTFDPLPASVKPRDLRAWTDVPSFNDAYPRGRPVLDRRIDALLDEIAAKSV